MKTDSIGPSATMKLLQETEDATNDRKFIKSQVEKRRRERMNRSLECLRNMLLQEPQQLGGAQRRVEKAEILEHTVLFLQNTAKEDKTRAGGGGGGRKHSFQDGFSTCLQRAAQFLGPEGKGLWLGAALDASFAARFARSDSDSAGVQGRTEARSSTSSLPRTKSILRMLRQKSKHRLDTRAYAVNSSVVHPYQRPVQKGFPRVPQQPQKKSQLELRVASRASKQSPSQSCPLSQTMWRPWP
ncbi:enhancer of split mgamma protein-like [Seriola aureovittata]|uniref:enhancer of split mgamma protein-like n=1 Tax=Seriola aureovittata TaxID=2871759 RepID=UPI0024BE8CEF|nr:enhancer of split mgamma protein-like [Seriola aureovittata]